MYWLQWERKYVDQLFISFILFCFPNSDLVEADIYFLASVLTWLGQQRIPILTPYKMHILQHQTPNNFMHQEKNMKKISIFRYLLRCDFRETNNFLVFVEVYKNISPAKIFGIPGPGDTRAGGCGHPRWRRGRRSGMSAPG